MEQIQATTHERASPPHGSAAAAGRFGLARYFGRELLRLALDRVVRSNVPRRIENVDASIMSRLLGRSVAAVERLDASHGTTTRARFALRGDGVPATVFVKLAAEKPVARLFGNLANLGANEVGFYRDVRPKLEVEAPRPLGLGFEPRTKRFVIVLEDLEARGCALADTRTPFTLQQATAMLETLAAVHGFFYATAPFDTAGRAASLAWVTSNTADPLLPFVSRALRPIAERTARRDASLVPRSGRAMLASYRAVALELDAGVHTILHGDPHPGNCYFVDGRAGLFDWQVLRRGNALRDVAYFLVLALDPTTRRQHERDLLRVYSTALAGAGGPSLTQDAAWETYRKMAAYPYVAATFTVGLGGLQNDPVAREGLVRAVAAIEDLETAEALGLAM